MSYSALPRIEYKDDISLGCLQFARSSLPGVRTASPYSSMLRQVWKESYLKYRFPSSIFYCIVRIYAFIIIQFYGHFVMWRFTFSLLDPDKN